MCTSSPHHTKTKGNCIKFSILITLAGGHGTRILFGRSIFLFLAIFNIKHFRERTGREAGNGAWNIQRTPKRFQHFYRCSWEQKYRDKSSLQKIERFRGEEFYNLYFIVGCDFHVIENSIIVSAVLYLYCLYSIYLSLISEVFHRHWIVLCSIILPKGTKSSVLELQHYTRHSTLNQAHFEQAVQT